MFQNTNSSYVDEIIVQCSKHILLFFDTSSINPQLNFYKILNNNLNKKEIIFISSLDKPKISSKQYDYFKKIFLNKKDTAKDDFKNLINKLIEQDFFTIKEIYQSIEKSNLVYLQDDNIIVDGYIENSQIECNLNQYNFVINGKKDDFANIFPICYETNFLEKLIAILPKKIKVDESFYDQYKMYQENNPYWYKENNKIYIKYFGRIIPKYYLALAGFVGSEFEYSEKLENTLKFLSRYKILEGDDNISVSTLLKNDKIEFHQDRCTNILRSKNNSDETLMPIFDFEDEVDIFQNYHSDKTFALLKSRNAKKVNLNISIYDQSNILEFKKNNCYKNLLSNIKLDQHFINDKFNLIYFLDDEF